MKKSLALAFLFSVFVAFSAADECRLPTPVSDITVGADDSGYVVTVVDSEQKIYPISKLPIVLSHEDLMSVFDGRVFFLTYSIRSDRWQGGVSRGPSGILAYKAFLQSVGLDVRRADSGGWVVGSPNALDNVAIYQFTFPWVATSWAGPDAGVVRLITSFVNTVLYHTSSLPPGDDPARQVAAVGIYPIDDAEGEYLVTAYFFEYLVNVGNDVTGLNMRLSLRRDADSSVDCLWISGPVGRLVPEFQEDVDGDGVRDFLFFPGPENNAPSFLISGKDGSKIARFLGDGIAVGNGTDGTYVALDHRLYYRIGKIEADSGFNVYSWVDGVGLELAPENAAEASSTDEKTFSREPQPAAALMRHGVDAASITFYIRPVISRYTWRSEARLVKPADVPGWDFSLKRQPHGAFGTEAPAEVTPQLIYVPPKFAQWWKDLWGDFPRVP